MLSKQQYKILRTPKGALATQGGTLANQWNTYITMNKAFDNRTKSTREIWRQLQATRFHKANPDLKINTIVSGTPDPPEVVFTFIDDTEKRFDSQSLKANEIMFDVHLDLDRLDNEYEMSGKSLDS